MQYKIILNNKRKDDWFWFIDSFLPGIKVPEHVVPMLMLTFAEKRGFCKDCDMDSHCHPLNAEGNKFCTILLHDAVRPKWTLKDVV